MGIQINGNNDIISALDGSWTAEGASINTSGILTATTFVGNITGTAATFTGPVTIGGTLTYEDVTNIDSVGIITARDGLKVLGGGANVVGVVTATSFVGGLPITNGADNRVITASSASAIQGESGLTYSGGTFQISANSPQLQITESDTSTSSRLVMSGGRLYIQIAQQGQGSSTSAGIMYLTGYNNTTASEIHLKANNTYNTGHFHLEDAQEIKIGNSDDFRIYHSTDNYIKSVGTSQNLIFDVNGSERLRITSGGHTVTQGLTSYSFNNDSANVKIFEVTGDGTVGEYGVINISGNQNANNGNIGTLRFVNRENSTSSSTGSATSKQVASIQAYIRTSDTNAGDDSGGILTFHTKGEDEVNSEKVRIDEAGRLLIGNFGSDIGDSKLQVYTSDRKHPAIRTNSPNANGYTMFGDAYQSDESQVNIGVSYSSSSLVISRSCKVSDTADNAYLSSQDTYATRPCALRLSNDGAISFHTTETNATVATDSAVSLTEVFSIDRVGNIRQKISSRYMYFGANQELQIGVNGSDGYLNSASGDLQIRDAGNPITIVRSDGFQMYQDIYFAAAGKGICLGTTSNTDSNTLDDYEEGDLTWYLRKSGSTSTGNDTGSVVKYTKVGRMVHISGRIRTDSVGSASNDYFYLDGTLPFTPVTPGTSVVGHWRSQDQLDNSLTASIAWLADSTTIYLYTIDSKSDYNASSNNVPASHQTNLVMTFSFTYQAT